MYFVNCYITLNLCIICWVGDLCNVLQQLYLVYLQTNYDGRAPYADHGAF